MIPTIALRHITKLFTDTPRHPFLALKDINLEIQEGELFIFLGPSGCGKSTLLRIMSGLDQSYEGTVRYAESVKKIDTNFVFQQFALLPWLTVSENVEIGLLAQNIPKEERKKIIGTELKLLGLERFAHAYPRELSGGMRQRVGIARAFATNPKIIFMDEPFSELDSFTAEELRKKLLGIWKERKPTIVMVTHNIEEALELGDRIAVLSSRPGKIEQIVENPLPRPREKRSDSFFALEDKLDALIKLHS